LIHLKNGTIMPKNVQELPPNLQAIIADYGVKIGDEAWYTKVWKALRCLTMMAKSDEKVKHQMKKLIQGNRGWSAVGFREVVEALRLIPLEELKSTEAELEEEFSGYFEAKEKDAETTEQLKSKLQELEAAKTQAQGVDKSNAARNLSVLRAFIKAECTVLEYISDLKERIKNSSSKKKKKTTETTLTNFNILLEM
jgi:hypothetical protein